MIYGTTSHFPYRYIPIIGNVIATLGSYCIYGTQPQPIEYLNTENGRWPAIPTIMLHAASDPTVPLHQSLLAYERMPQETRYLLIVPHSKHSQLMSRKMPCYREVYTALQTFLCAYGFYTPHEHRIDSLKNQYQLSQQWITGRLQSIARRDRYYAHMGQAMIVMVGAYCCMTYINTILRVHSGATSL